MGNAVSTSFGNTFGQFSDSPYAGLSTSPASASWTKATGELAQYVTAAPSSSLGTVWKRGVLTTTNHSDVFARALAFGGSAPANYGVAVFTGGTSAASPGTLLAQYYGAPGSGTGFTYTVGGPITVDVVWEVYASWPFTSGSGLTLSYGASLSTAGRGWVVGAITLN